MNYVFLTRALGESPFGAWIYKSIWNRLKVLDLSYNSEVDNLFRTADRFETELFLRTGL